MDRREQAPGLADCSFAAGVRCPLSACCAHRRCLLREPATRPRASLRALRSGVRFQYLGDLMAMGYRVRTPSHSAPAVRSAAPFKPASRTCVCRRTKRNMHSPRQAMRLTRLWSTWIRTPSKGSSRFRLPPLRRRRRRRPRRLRRPSQRRMSLRIPLREEARVDEALRVQRQAGAAAECGVGEAREAPPRSPISAAPTKLLRLLRRPVLGLLWRLPPSSPGRRTSKAAARVTRSGILRASQNRRSNRCRSRSRCRPQM